MFAGIKCRRWKSINFSHLGFMAKDVYIFSLKFTSGLTEFGIHSNYYKYHRCPKQQSGQHQRAKYCYNRSKFDQSNFRHSSRAQHLEFTVRSSVCSVSYQFTEYINIFCDTDFSHFKYRKCKQYTCI